MKPKRRRSTGTNHAAKFHVLRQRNERLQSLRGEPLESRQMLSAVGFVEHEIVKSDFETIHSSAVADFDGDGDLDVVVTDSNVVGIYENLDAGDEYAGFHPLELEAGSYSLADVRLFAEDMDDDGDPDLIASTQNSRAILWLENDGNSSFQLKDAWSDGFQWPNALNGDGIQGFADLDGDNDLDLLTSFQSGVAIVNVWYENLDGMGTFGEAIELDREPDRMSMVAVDFDADGDLDVLSKYQFGNKIVLYENLDDDAAFGPRQVIQDNAKGINILATDLDNDGDVDVVTFDFSAGSLLRFENVGGTLALGEPINTSANARFLADGDFDSDGHQDILATTFAGTDDEKIVWIRNLGDGTFVEGQPINFIGPERFVSSVRIADVDLDGRPDILTSGQNIRWRANVESDGSFGESQLISEVGAMAIYDLDIDVDDDIDIVARTEDGEIVWHENLDGSGAYSDRHLITSEAGSSGLREADMLVVSDLNSDGHPDILFADSGTSSTPGQISWVQNQGDGSFATAETISPDVNLPRSVHAADLDGDGHLDVLTASNDGVTWYRNANGHGEFETSRPIGEEGISVAVYAADIDGDGDKDVVSIPLGELRQTGDERLVWYENTDGKGAFSVAMDIVPGADFRVTSSASLGIADVDADGDADVLVENGHISWFENLDGEEGFKKAQRITDNDRLSFGTSFVVDDVDSDGDKDVLLASSRDDSLTWYENQKVATDGARTTLSAVGFVNHEIMSSDFKNLQNTFSVDVDGDGDVDVLAHNGHRIGWYKNQGNHEYSAAKFITRVSHDKVELGDMNGDGNMDIVVEVTNGARRHIAWIANEGSGIFAAPIVIAEPSGSEPGFFAVDVDGDEDLDVLYAEGWSENTDGNGTFSKHYSHSSTPLWTGMEHRTQSSSLSAGLRQAHVGDADGDGDIDVFATVRQPATIDIVWYENVDGKTFSEPKMIATEPDQIGLHFADVDADNDLDVVAAFFHEKKLVWYENDGGTNFLAETVIDAEGVTRALTADIDGDGDLDVVSDPRGTSFFGGPSNLTWYEQDNETGAFTNRHVVAESSIPANIADLDGDGDVDLIGDSGVWFENHGRGSFGEPTLLFEEPMQVSIEPTDLDGDGDLDLVATSGEDATEVISVLQNTDGVRRFAAAQQLNLISPAPGLISVVMADIDRDGDPDLATTAWVDGELAWHTNDGSGSFGQENIISLGQLQFPWPLAAVDLDQDQDVDLLNKGAWYENFGDGFFGEPQDIGTELVTADASITADLDGDGDLDVITRDTSFSRLNGVSVHKGEILWYEHLNGTGAFAEPQIISEEVKKPDQLLAADVDGDGDQDLVVVGVAVSDDIGDEPTIVWLENVDGGNTFGLPQSIVLETAGFIWSDIRVVDLDDDGDIDVLVPITSRQEIEETGLFEFDTNIVWYENVGGGNFSEMRVIATGFDSVFAADLDADGDQDVLSNLESGDGSIFILENLGRGTFTAPKRFIADLDRPLVKSVLDIDGDGDLDVLSRSGIADKITWHERRLGGDTNDDGVVNFVDFLVLARNYEDVDAAWSDGDFTGDGIVDFEDFGILSSNYGRK